MPPRSLQGARFEGAPNGLARVFAVSVLKKMVLTGRLIVLSLTPT
jgi:hypothetical protein